MLPEAHVLRHNLLGELHLLGGGHGGASGSAIYVGSPEGREVICEKELFRQELEKKVCDLSREVPSLWQYRGPQRRCFFWICIITVDPGPDFCNNQLEHFGDSAGRSPDLDSSCPAADHLKPAYPVAVTSVNSGVDTRFTFVFQGGCF
jgi:hypothetical protein